MFDLRNANQIDVEDLGALLSLLHISPLQSELAEIKSDFKGRSGKIKFKEFMEILKNLQHRKDDRTVLVESFMSLADDSSPMIPIESLKKMLMS